LGKKPYETARALKLSEIPGIVEEYRVAARNAKAAGFDGVEIHAANGYLIDQFLQSKTNHREDAYGGTIENRFRLLSEILDAVAQTWTKDRIAVRLAPNGSFNGMGSSDFREQFSHVIRELDAHGLMYLHAVDGLAFGFHQLGEPMTLAEIRSSYRHPLMGNCGYTREAAEEAIQSGQADMIAFGRPYISNPDLADRFARNLPLAEDAPVTVWSSPGAEGYTDFPQAAVTA
jgi:N-ethylmaleimide reductase